MLALSVSLAHPSTKFLLVDEIDTGLHHSAMVDMWRMVTETAKTLDVQVFATTHSRDCVDALAAVCTDNGTDISLQRIEAGKDRSISYSEGEIIAAAKYGIETR
jgi:AAA15 family ATPase/GTPase